MNLRAIRMGQLISILAILIMLTGRWFAHGSLEDYLFGIGFALIVVGIIVLAFAQRCPRCGYHVAAAPFWWGRPGYCRKCGNRLVYDREL